MRSRGAVYVEALVVIPLLVVFILGLVQLSLLWQVKLGARYAAYCAARAVAVHGGGRRYAQSAALLALTPVMPRISGVFADAAAAPSVILDALQARVQEYTGMIAGYAGSVARGAVKELGESVSSSLNVRIPMPDGYDVNVNIARLLPLDAVENFIAGVAGELTGGALSFFTERIFSSMSLASGPGRHYSVPPAGRTSRVVEIAERYLTAKYFTEIRVLDETGGEVTGQVSAGELVTVEVIVHYPLPVPVVRRLMGSPPRRLPDNPVARIFESTGAGYFSRVVARSTMRIEGMREREGNPG